MRFSRWFVLIGVMVGLGCLRVAQQNALYLQGYAVADRLGQLSRAERDVAWLQTQVTRLSSPAALAAAAQQQRLTLVAWSTLTPEALVVAPAESNREPARPRSATDPLVGTSARAWPVQVADDATAD